MKQTFRQKLIHLIGFVQNQPEFINQDILTFTGFLDDRELTGYFFERFAKLNDAAKAHLHNMVRDMRAQSEQAA